MTIAQLFRTTPHYMVTPAAHYVPYHRVSTTSQYEFGLKFEVFTLKAVPGLGYWLPLT